LSNHAPARTLLLTGATGFVGQAVYPALVAAGWTVRCASRDPVAAARRWPGRSWVALDVSDPDSVSRALEGCQAALYLVHGMASHAGNYRDAELTQARLFSESATAAGLRRIVYLGGVAAPRDASEHLRSREEVGAVLRAGTVPTLELRASMIIGHGSLSWLMVRDLAARLPVMVLPRWLKSRTQPVAIDDVVVALVRGLDMPLPDSQWCDIPGPYTLSGRDILERTARSLGVRQPLMISVPFLSPRLSSHWVRFVTRAEWAVAREVVVGLKTDLLATAADYWQRIDHTQLLDFDEAARRAIARAAEDGPVPGVWGFIERALAATALTEPGVSRGRVVVSSVLLWALAALASQWLGIWLSVGPMALVLGLATLRHLGASALGQGPHLRWLAAGSGAGLLMAVATIALYEPVTQAFPSLRPDVEALYDAFRSPGVVVTMFVMPIVVVGEELVWRGLVLGKLLARIPAGAATLAGTLLYAAAHAPIGSPALVMACLGAGFCWSAIRVATGSVVAALVAHLVWDYAVLVFYQLTPA